MRQTADAPFAIAPQAEARQAKIGEQQLERHDVFQSWYFLLSASACGATVRATTVPQFGTFGHISTTTQLTCLPSKQKIATVLGFLSVLRSLGLCKVGSLVVSGQKSPFY